MKLKLLVEDEFDFLDTDEPVQDGDDDFNDPEDALYEFIDELNGQYGSEYKAPHVEDGKTRYYVRRPTIGNDDRFIDVTEEVESHPLFVSSRPYDKFREIDRVTIITNITRVTYGAIVTGTIFHGSQRRWQISWSDQI